MAKHALLVLLAACSANDDIPAPQLSAAIPAAATAGAIVTVEGSYFCQQPDTGNEDPLSCTSMGEVSFGASPGTISQWTDTAIMVEVPQGVAGTVALSVTVNGRSSNSISFHVQ